jgi:hypothetical protein
VKEYCICKNECRLSYDDSWRVSDCNVKVFEDVLPYKYGGGGFKSCNDSAFDGAANDYKVYDDTLQYSGCGCKKTFL